MDLGAIIIFKVHYLQTIFARAGSSIEDDKVIFWEFWKSCNILQYIKNIAVAWEDVCKKCMKGMWKCLKQNVNSSKGFNKFKHVNKINKRTVFLANTLSLEVELDVENLVKCNIMVEGFRFMPLGLVRLRTFRLSAWVT